MGIGYSSAALLGKAKQHGVRFDKILTIGHQTLYLLPRHIEMLAQMHGLKLDPADFPFGAYADDFLKVFLGAEEVISLDCSSYEHCDIVHDMNRPIDPSLHGTFDVVIDGGSLEHIFNFPVAVANCMNLVKVGGSLFIFTPANNYMGHGFYQFSPELFFRIFDEKYGFRMCDAVLESHSYPGAEYSPRTRCYSVTDPVVVRSRVGLVSPKPAQMLVHAEKTRSQALFSDHPIQSDYATEHSDYDMAHGAPGDPGRERQIDKDTGQPYSRPWRSPTHTGLVAFGGWVVRERLPLRMRHSILGKLQLRQYSLSNRRFYRRWYP